MSNDSNNPGATLSCASDGEMIYILPVTLEVFLPVTLEVSYILITEIELCTFLSLLCFDVTCILFLHSHQERWFIYICIYCNRHKNYITNIVWKVLWQVWKTIKPPQIMSVLHLKKAVGISTFWDFHSVF